MPHSITEDCIGCTACVKVCPVDCIDGDRGILHDIDLSICIDCGACGRVCPVDAILDERGIVTHRVKRSAWPRPIIEPDLCTGCNYCVDICPYDCLDLVDKPDVNGFNMIAELVDARACVGCFMCEEVCNKDALFVVPPEDDEAA